MINYLKAERLKQKHRFTLKLLWLSPLIAITLVILLMGGRFFMEGAFNWWYTMLLPGSLSMIVAFNIAAEKKHNRHGLFSVSVHKKALWLSQLFMNTVLLLLTNLFFFIALVVIGTLLGLPLPIFKSFIASLVLFITFAWQIPLFMFISEKMGSFFSILISLFLNIGFGVFFAASPLWYIPFAIPSRLMCPIINVLPNGLPLEAGHPLADPSPIFIGLIITLGAYIVLSQVTTLWFDHREVK